MHSACLDEKKNCHRPFINLEDDYVMALLYVLLNLIL